MDSSSPKSALWRGVRDSAPFLLVVSPFAMIFGVVSTEAGFSILETMGFGFLVIAGASQFAAVQLMAENTPTVIVILTALAVNLRMAMYSATLTPHLGGASIWTRAIAAYCIVDQSFALSADRFDRHPSDSLSAKIAYFFGTVLLIFPVWHVSTYVGAAVGGQIPDAFALDFAVPITFLAMIAPMLRTRAHLAAAFVAVIASLTFAFLPYNLGLIVAGIMGMVVGAEVERRTEGESL
ncbi:MAG: AzlC family ABC transporter permease [Halocynthiibacter sp.]